MCQNKHEKGARKGGIGMRRDWEKIETDYMAGKMTYAEIAEKYGIPVASVERQGTKRGWVKKRKEFAEKVQTKARNRTAEKKASREAELYGRVVKLAEQLVEVLEGSLQDEKQLYRHLIGMGAGVQKEKVLKKMDTAAAKDYASMLISIGKMMADYSGMLTKKDAETLRMAKEKLKLEKQKAEAEQKTENETVEIIFGGAGGATTADGAATAEDAGGGRIEAENGGDNAGDSGGAAATPAETWEAFSE